MDVWAINPCMKRDRVEHPKQIALEKLGKKLFASHHIITLALKKWRRREEGKKI